MVERYRGLEEKLKVYGSIHVPRIRIRSIIDQFNSFRNVTKGG